MSAHVGSSFVRVPLEPHVATVARGAGAARDSRIPIGSRRTALPGLPNKGLQLTARRMGDVRWLVTGSRPVGA